MPIAIFFWSKRYFIYLLGKTRGAGALFRKRVKRVWGEKGKPVLRKNIFLWALNYQIYDLINLSETMG